MSKPDKPHVQAVATPPSGFRPYQTTQLHPTTRKVIRQVRVLRIEGNTATVVGLNGPMKDAQYEVNTNVLNAPAKTHVQAVSAADRRANPNWREEARGETPPTPKAEPSTPTPKASPKPEPPGKPTHIATKELSPAVQSMLKGKGYGARDIQVVPASTVDSYSEGNRGQRGFVEVINLDTGQHQGRQGSWGGGNMFTDSPVDSGKASIPIPENGAVLKGSTGYPRTFATLYVHPKAMGRMLPSGEAEAPLTRDEQAALYAHTAIKGGQYRRDELRRLGVPPSAVDSLVASGHLKRNKAGNAQVTTKGKNAREQYPLAKNGYVNPNNPVDANGRYLSETHQPEETEVNPSQQLAEAVEARKSAATPDEFTRARARERVLRERLERPEALTEAQIDALAQPALEATRRLEESAKTAGYSVTPHPFGKPGGPGLWHHKGLQLPPYVQNLAHGMREKTKGMSVGQAVSLAIGAIKRWSRGGGKVSPEVRAASAAALAQWEALKASHGGGRARSAAKAAAGK